MKKMNGEKNKKTSGIKTAEKLVCVPCPLYELKHFSLNSSKTNSSEASLSHSFCSLYYVSTIVSIVLILKRDYSFFI